MSTEETTTVAPSPDAMYADRLAEWFGYQIKSCEKDAERHRKRLDDAIAKGTPYDLRNAATEAEALASQLAVVSRAKDIVKLLTAEERPAAESVELLREWVKRILRNAVSTVSCGGDLGWNKADAIANAYLVDRLLEYGEYGAYLDTRRALLNNELADEWVDIERAFNTAEKMHVDLVTKRSRMRSEDRIAAIEQEIGQAAIVREHWTVRRDEILSRADEQLAKQFNRVTI